MLASAMSSSSTGAWPHHSPRRWPRIRQVSPMRSRYCTAGLRSTCDGCLHRRPHMWSTRLGQLVEGRVAVDLVFHRVEVHVLVARVAGHDLVGAHHPDADAFLAPRVDVARHLDRHLRVGRVQAAAVLVVQAGLAAHEHFPQRPFVGSSVVSLSGMLLSLMRPPAASPACAHGPAPLRAPRRRRPRPSTRAPRRSRLHGPSPPIDAPELAPVDRRRSRSGSRSSFHLQLGVGQRHAEHLGLLDGRRRRTSGAGRRW